MREREEIMRGKGKQRRTLKYKRKLGRRIRKEEEGRRKSRNLKPESRKDRARSK